MENSLTIVEADKIQRDGYEAAKNLDDLTICPHYDRGPEYDDGPSIEEWEYGWLRGVMDLTNYNAMNITTPVEDWNAAGLMDEDEVLKAWTFRGNGRTTLMLVRTTRDMGDYDKVYHRVYHIEDGVLSRGAHHVYTADSARRRFNVKARLIMECRRDLGRFRSKQTA